MKNSGLYKGCLEPIILNLLKDNKRMYGYEITQKVKDLTKGQLTITEGALYPLLHRLEAEGIIEPEIEHIGNRIRKYYSLTKSGKKETVKNLEELKKFIETMNQFIQTKTSVYAK